ncbi:hypothetical protein Tco_0748985 [Tanacetum coccineum]|uniref:Retrotransposon gag domain-containing protein n=1 Tax=Tanacetum coccineum TaxID=301880 RepID=A0ABQ4YX52_9ASTR
MVKTLGMLNAYQIPLEQREKLDDHEYCPATEIQRMEPELWTLTLKGDDIEAYSNRFHELVLMCPELVVHKSKKIEKGIFVGFLKESKETSLLQSLRPCMRQSTWPVNWSSNQFKNVTCLGVVDTDIVRTSVRKAGNQQNDESSWESRLTVIVVSLSKGKILEFKAKVVRKRILVYFACYQADEKSLMTYVLSENFLEILHTRCPSEMLELSNQLKELQEKGFIRPSHSPWGAPNRYPLPRIEDLFDTNYKMRVDVFSNIDIRFGDIIVGEVREERYTKNRRYRDSIRANFGVLVMHVVPGLLALPDGPDDFDLESIGEIASRTGFRGALHCSTARKKDLNMRYKGGGDRSLLQMMLSSVRSTTYPRCKAKCVLAEEERRKTVVSAVGEDQGGSSMPRPIGLISLIASVGIIFLERAIKLSLDPSFLPQRQAPVGGVAIHERVAEVLGL